MEHISAFDLETKVIKLCFSQNIRGSELCKPSGILKARKHSGRFEVFTTVITKIIVFWDVTPCGSCKNRRFGRTYFLHHQGDKNRRARNFGSN
jgi:hypothetical protein